MIYLYIILIIIASIGVCFFILIQNPKGGGLAEPIGGLSNNFMGVKQTTDILEKTTWVLISVIVFLSLTSTIFLKQNNANETKYIDNINSGNTLTK